jgi:hypothetical protein
LQLFICFSAMPQGGHVWSANNTNTASNLPQMNNISVRADEPATLVWGSAGHQQADSNKSAGDNDLLLMSVILNGSTTTKGPSLGAAGCDRSRPTGICLASSAAAEVNDTTNDSLPESIFLKLGALCGRNHCAPGTMAVNSTQAATALAVKHARNNYILLAPLVLQLPKGHLQAHAHFVTAEQLAGTKSIVPWPPTAAAGHLQQCPITTWVPGTAVAPCNAASTPVAAEDTCPVDEYTDVAAQDTCPVDEYTDDLVHNMDARREGPNMPGQGMITRSRAIHTSGPVVAGAGGPMIPRPIASKVIALMMPTGRHWAMFMPRYISTIYNSYIGPDQAAAQNGKALLVVDMHNMHLMNNGGMCSAWRTCPVSPAMNAVAVVLRHRAVGFNLGRPWHLLQACWQLRSSFAALTSMGRGALMTVTPYGALAVTTAATQQMCWNDGSRPRFRG